MIKKNIFTNLLLRCGERDFMENMIRKVTSTKEINHKGQGLYVQLRRLHGDIKQVQKEYPHLFASSTAIARKIGFPDVIVQGGILLHSNACDFHWDFINRGCTQ